MTGIIQMKDRLLEMFFDKQRWESAIQRGIVKDIDKGILSRLCEEDKLVDGRLIPSPRTILLEMIRSGKYNITPPHTAKIPKDNGEFRTVYANEGADRVILAIINDLLFETCSDMVHASCKSYLKGIGCGMVVQELSKRISRIKVDNSKPIGWKADFTKYFDRVPIEYIDKAFDEVERRMGKSALIDVLRRYYHCDWYYDTEAKEYVCKYQSLKQGCAVASFLANVIMYPLDEYISHLDVVYYRYCDDTICFGKDAEKGFKFMENLMQEMSTEDLDMRLNEKKVEDIYADKWFKFIGFSICGDQISLSSTRIKTFQKTIEELTIKSGKPTDDVIQDVMRYLYVGDGEHSWATQVLPIINNEHDIDELNKFAMDAIRASITGKRKIGGLGYDPRNAERCVYRGTGKNVTANRKKTGSKIKGYQSLRTMQHALKYNKQLYTALINQ